MFKMTGLNEMIKKLDGLAKRAKELDGKNTVSMNELLTPAFISAHTQFGSANEMFGASDFRIESHEDFESIPDDKWDEFVRSVSDFPDWQAMLGEASSEWAARKLGF